MSSSSFHDEASSLAHLRNGNSLELEDEHESLLMLPATDSMSRSMVRKRVIAGFSLFTITMIAILQFLEQRKFHHSLLSHSFSEKEELLMKVAASRRKRPKEFDYVSEDPFRFADKDDFFLTEGLHLSPPAPTGPCSCWNTSTHCCERSVHGNHKFGHNLVNMLFDSKKSQYHRDGINLGTAHFRRGVLGFRSPPDYFDRGGKDYREVFLSRNFWEALASGYLYHRDGHECWLSAQCRPRKAPPLLVPDDIIQLPSPPFPAPNNRSICHYISEESEEFGMRVYMEWVMRLYYGPQLGIFKAVQENEDPFHRRTLFVCYEDLYYPAKKQETIQRVMNWLYPGGQEQGLPPPVFDEYDGCHASNHDPALRARLRDIARRLDRQVFKGVFQKAQEAFGRCGEDESSNNRH